MKLLLYSMFIDVCLLYSTNTSFEEILSFCIHIRHTNFKLAEPEMEDQAQVYLADKDYKSALKSFSAIELEVEERSLWEDSVSTLGNYFYTSYLACYLITGDLPSAKYLWKRAPDQFKQPESGSFLCELWTVAKAVWQNDVPAAINSLAIDWPVELQLLVFELREQLLRTQLNTIARAFEHISMESLSQKLGISQEETLQRAQNIGWIVEGGVVRPTSRPSQLDGVGNSLSDNLAMLQKVTTYAAHFDRAPVAVDK